MGLSGIGQNAAFGNLHALSYEGVQFGYNFQATGNLPVTVYAGFNTLKYNPGIGDPFTSFDSSSSTQSGYTAHAGVEIPADIESQPVTRGRLHPAAGAHQFARATRCFSVSAVTANTRGRCPRRGTIALLGDHAADSGAAIVGEQ